ncbi:hypothetical protein SAMN02745857_04356 [Andreprevotia lacus DSM 23236]|jgi:hypothetical protein|uniref:Uncharacterized protein n=1 Tax=Andreprevotia lacus DSM 23236 TaxID=1121001 RepID=A0A1W1Y1I5_9NEIS|nr:hypothetical protein [Andreprevotia lacus]SMC30012.1 hypothetical protein SAMN02745857_04356 [Andreprevotia lacus DSM 23236]
MNNIEFLTSIKINTDFEEIVRRFVQKIWSVDAYIVNGPYDDGKDLVFSERGRQKREAVQITIQKSNFENKLKEDLVKTQRLVDDHDYPNNLTFFSSQTYSESVINDFVTMARRDYGINLHFYDAKRISQKITEEYPDILKFIIEDIHNYKGAGKSGLDSVNRSLYDFLALSGESATIKKSIVDAQILSLIYQGDTSSAAVIELLKQSGTKESTARHHLSNLIKSGKLIVDNDSMLKMSISELNRVKSVELANEKQCEELSGLIVARVGMSDVGVASRIVELFKDAYRHTVDLHISELNFQDPNEEAIKQTMHLLKAELKSSCGVDGDRAELLARDLIEIASSNEYLSNYCSSQLCINLLNQSKLEAYIKEKHFFVYLDATVFIRHLAAMQFRDIKSDQAFYVTQRLIDAINQVPRKTIRITSDHLEETIRHLDAAYKLSLFANDDLIATLGDSKNVYFNAYLARRSKIKGYDFSEFISDFIGFDIAANAGYTFDGMLRCASKILDLHNIQVVSTASIEEIDFTRLNSAYLRAGGKLKKTQGFINDVNACIVLSDTRNHLDDTKTGQIPIFVTWDSSIGMLRDAYRNGIDKYAEWIVYSPHKASERLTMAGFKIDKSYVRDSLLCILDDDIFKDTKSSLLDNLALFVKGDGLEVDNGAVISLVVKLAEEVNNEPIDKKEFESDSYAAINEILLETFFKFKNRLPSVRKVFGAPGFSNRVFDLISLSASNLRADSGDDLNKYISSLEALIDEYESSCVDGN